MLLISNKIGFNTFRVSLLALDQFVTICSVKSLWLEWKINVSDKGPKTLSSGTPHVIVVILKHIA